MGYIGITNTSKMETVEIKQTSAKLIISEAVVEGATLNTACINGLQAYDIAATNVKIVNANLSDLEIESAQLGGAFIHNIGMPPEGHPHYDANAKQRPLRFEDCDLNSSTITNCDLTDVSISSSIMAGLKIDGILLEDLLKAYNAGK
jgi:uncharacterized protein YjbI with pentapeptide repeats